MELTAYNPQKGRLETLDIEFTAENTTRFTITGNGDAVATITDFNGGLLIKKLDRTYPILLDDLSRADIDYSREKARELILLHE